MDELVLFLVQILQIALLAGAVFGIFAGIAALRTYLQQKMGMQVNYDWNQILAFVFTAVKAVAQIHKERPANVSDEEWNKLRFHEAEEAVIAYANSLGIHVDADFLTTVRTAIEAAVASLKKKDSVVLPIMSQPVVGPTVTPLAPPFIVTS